MPDCQPTKNCISYTQITLNQHCTSEVSINMILLWQLCATMMGCVEDELSWLFTKNSFLSYLQKIAESFSKFLLFPFLNFHVSGSPESNSKQPTQLIVELNSSFRHIIVTQVTFLTFLKKTERKSAQYVSAKLLSRICNISV